MKLSERLIDLYAEYVEGDIKRSGDKYNALIKTCSVSDILEIIDNTPFERHAVKLYDALSKVVQMPEHIVRKVAKYKVYLKELDAKYTQLTRE